MRYACKVVVGKLEGKRPQVRHGPRQEDNRSVDLGKILFWVLIGYL
jgi:hypothetical protein